MFDVLKNNSSRKQFKVVSSKTINHHINRTLSIQAYPKIEGQKITVESAFFYEKRIFQWQLYKRNPYTCTFERNLVGNLKRVKTKLFRCLDMFIWLPLYGAKCKIWQWSNSSEENIASWDERKAGNCLGGKCSIRKNLENFYSFWPIQSFFLPCAKFFANNFYWTML